MRKKVETFIIVYTKYYTYFFKKPNKEFYEVINTIKDNDIFLINDKQSYKQIFKFFKFRAFKKIKSFAIKVSDIKSIEEKQVDYYEA